MQFSGKRTKRLPEVPIIPMIDTMFFLLVFFILTSLNIIKLEGINVNLPEAKNVQKQQPKKAELTVSITAKEDVYVNGKQVPKGQDIGPVLLSRLKSDLGHTPSTAELADQSVIINADGSTPHRDVIASIDQARGVHINKFTLATTSEQEKANAGTPAGGVKPQP